MRILIVEDDIVIGKNIESALREEHFAVVIARDGIEGEGILLSQNFDCVILDINLPGKNGFDVCRAFRKVNQHTPVLLLTAFDELDDKVEGYDSGADDYLTKPFYMKELTLRIHALTKRNQALQEVSSRENQTEQIETSGLTINLKLKKVYKADEEIILTPREFQILLKLAEAGGAPVSKTELVKEIWGSIFEHNTNTIEVYVNFLRNKIDKPFNTQTIKTRIGYGYYLDTGADGLF